MYAYMGNFSNSIWEINLLFPRDVNVTVLVLRKYAVSALVQRKRTQLDVS